MEKWNWQSEFELTGVDTERMICEIRPGLRAVFLSYNGNHLAVGTPHPYDVGMLEKIEFEIWLQPGHEFSDDSALEALTLAGQKLASLVG